MVWRAGERGIMSTSEISILRAELDEARAERDKAYELLDTMRLAVTRQRSKAKSAASAGAVLLQALQKVHALVGACDEQRFELDDDISRRQDIALIEIFNIIENLIGEGATHLVDLDSPRELLERLSRYEVALAWYANDAAWDAENCRDDIHDYPVMKDLGERAQNALDGRGETAEDAYWGGFAASSVFYPDNALGALPIRRLTKRPVEHAVSKGDLNGMPCKIGIIREDGYQLLVASVNGASVAVSATQLLEIAGGAHEPA